MIRCAQFCSFPRLFPRDGGDRSRRLYGRTSFRSSVAVSGLRRQKLRRLPLRWPSPHLCFKNGLSLQRIVIGADGTVYVGSNDKNVYALNGAPSSALN